MYEGRTTTAIVTNWCGLLDGKLIKLLSIYFQSPPTDLQR